MNDTCKIVSASLDRFDERYSGFRIPRPRLEDALVKSMRRFGQLAPVVAVERKDALALVDGFKRLHAARQLGLEVLDVRSLPMSEQAAVGAVYSLNRYGQGMTDMEEALVVRALCRKHGLAQIEVGEILGRHKSWVCRRLMLIERLSKQVQEDVRVGLVSVTMAREIARLPRGNQSEVALSIHRNGLTSREGSVLVTLFEKTTDRTEQQDLLGRPKDVLDKHREEAGIFIYDHRLSARDNRLKRLLLSVQEGMSRLSQELRDLDPAKFTETQNSTLTPLLRITQGSISQLIKVFSSLESFDAS